MSWVTNEMAEINFDDVRLENRAVKLLEQLSKKPTDSIPNACGNWHETKAAYRFFDNNKVTSEQILKPHIKATIKRIKSEETVLLIQDTTELNFSGQKEKQHVGPSNRETDKMLFLHPLIAVTPEKCPLGVIDDLSWYKTELRKGKTKKEVKQIRENTPIEFKESYRWLLGYQKSCKVSELCPNTQIVCIGDRESDIYDLYQDADQRDINKRADWLVRAKTNRILLDEDSEPMPTLLFETMEESPEVGKIRITVPKRGNKKSREATLSVKIKQVQLQPPMGRKCKPNLELEPINVTVVATSEIKPPKGSEPVTWVLLTSVNGKNFEDAKKIMNWYLARWQIEVFFKTLKSGCKIEANQLTEESRFLPCFTMYLIISWRIMFITHVSRTNPKSSCECCYSKIEWQTIYKIGKKKKPPQKPPSVEEITILLAKCGGYLARKSDGPPGPKTIWLGLRQINDIIYGMEVMREL